MQEFYSAATEIEALCGLKMITVGRIEIQRAIVIERQNRFSFWDGLMVSAAETAGATTLYTEDLTHGQRIGALQIVNPFRTRPS